MSDNTPTVPYGVPFQDFPPRNRFLLYRLLEAEQEVIPAEANLIREVMDLIFKRMTNEEQRSIDPLVPVSNAM